MKENQKKTMNRKPRSKKQAPGAAPRKPAPQAAHMVSIDGVAKRSRLEVLFARGWEHQGGPELVEEHAFAKELAPGAAGAGRAWRFDFAHLPTKTAIEIDGGTFNNGRHNRGSGAAGDYEKFLAAHLAGWRVVRLTGKQITAVTIAALIGEIRGRMEAWRLIEPYPFAGVIQAPGAVDGSRLACSGPHDKASAGSILGDWRKGMPPAEFGDLMADVHGENPTGEEPAWIDPGEPETAGLV